MENVMMTRLETVDLVKRAVAGTDGRTRNVIVALRAMIDSEFRSETVDVSFLLKTILELTSQKEEEYELEVLLRGASYAVEQSRRNATLDWSEA